MWMLSFARFLILFLAHGILSVIIMSDVFDVQQFVTDRKVDEEIGTVRRFEGDLDDILPHIMGFGKGYFTNTLDWPLNSNLS